MFDSGSVKIGRYLGVEVYLHYSWFLIFFLVAWSLAVGFFPLAFPGLALPLMIMLALLTSILFFASVLVHELSHAYISNRLGLPIKRITLFIFGGVAHMTKEPEKPLHELKIAIAGPLASFAIGGLAATVWYLSKSLELSGVATSIAALIAQVNIVLGAFNLLPGFPLDGGRITRALIWRRTKDFKRATRISAYIGRAIGLGLVIFGFVELFLGSFVNGLWFIFIGFFLERLAESGYSQAKMKDALSHVRVSDLMSENVVTIPEDTSIDSTVHDYFLAHKFEGFPVVDKSGAITGIIEMSQLRLVPREKWPITPIKKIMLPMKPEFAISPKGNVTDALKVMSAHRIKRLPVMRSGMIIGVITQTDINHYLALQTEIMDS